MTDSIFEKYASVPVVVWFGEHPKKSVEVQYADRREFEGIRRALEFVQTLQPNRPYFDVIIHAPENDIHLTDEQVSEGINKL